MHYLRILVVLLLMSGSHVFADTLTVAGGNPTAGCTTVTVTSGAALLTCDFQPGLSKGNVRAFGDLASGIFGAQLGSLRQTWVELRTPPPPLLTILLFRE
jgi:hypothetical protein